LPRITIQAFRGRTTDQKRELARRITEATVEVFGVEPDIVTIRFDEFDKDNFSRGGVLQSERGTPTD
jgi:4-oxalocrotonate tautomerase